MREPEPDYIKLYEEETDKRFRKLIVAGDSDKILPKTVKHILGRAASSGPNEIADSSGGDENGEKSVKRIRGGPASSGCDVTREEVRRDWLHALSTTYIFLMYKVGIVNQSFY